MPIPDLWWVVEGKLAGGRKPDDGEILELKGLGVGGIVSMMDDPSNLDKYQALKYLDEATSLNITIEPLGGSAAPTVSRLIANHAI